MSIVELHNLQTKSVVVTIQTDRPEWTVDQLMRNRDTTQFTAVVVKPS